ncbi:hypothetical protein EDB84DRAFT_1653352 [Lactarius hengduanensis]|nr:hypothetical protein EDB84DRAFT_1653352 [Lactarius hengduanensis]
MGSADHPFSVPVKSESELPHFILGLATVLSCPEVNPGRDITPLLSVATAAQGDNVYNSTVQGGTSQFSDPLSYLPGHTDVSRTSGSWVERVAGVAKAIETKMSAQVDLHTSWCGSGVNNVAHLLFFVVMFKVLQLVASQCMPDQAVDAFSFFGVHIYALHHDE